MNAKLSPTPSTETVDIIRRLIGFDTVSRNSNLGLIEWVRDHLARLGVKSRLTYDAGGGKANLFATLGGAGGPGLVLCGHTDVVPVDGQPWDTDPFRAEIREGLIYGRGSCDMKSFIAGGTAPNIVPRDCEFQFDMRYLPGTDPSDFVERIERFAKTSLVPEMHEVSKDTGIRLELLTEAPDLNTAEDDRITTLGTQLTGNSALGRVGFATDGGHFHRAGVPTIVVGPGSIEQAHEANEFIALEQVVQCERFLARLRDNLSA